MHKLSYSFNLVFRGNFVGSIELWDLNVKNKIIIRATTGSCEILLNTEQTHFFLFPRENVFYFHVKAFWVKRFFRAKQFPSTKSEYNFP